MLPCGCVVVPGCQWGFPLALPGNLHPALRQPLAPHLCQQQHWLQLEPRCLEVLSRGSLWGGSEGSAVFCL